MPQVGSAQDRRFEAETNVDADGLPSGVRPESRPTCDDGFELWKVRDDKGGRPVVLKRLAAFRRDDPAAVGRFRTEVSVGLKVSSPYVVPYLAADLACEWPYALLEWLEGESLESRLAECGRLPLAEALWIARQTAHGLADLERAGFTHGDVKPAHVHLCPGGAAKLVDLSSASAVRDAKDPEIAPGVAPYLAPEVLESADHDPIARDIYSLGVTLFQMLAGRLPFEGVYVPDVLRMHRAARPPLLRLFRPDAGPRLSDLVSRMLAKQPLRRPSGLRPLLRELIALELETIDEASMAASL